MIVSFRMSKCLTGLQEFVYRIRKRSRYFPLANAKELHKVCPFARTVRNFFRRWPLPRYCCVLQCSIVIEPTAYVDTRSWSRRPRRVAFTLATKRNFQRVPFWLADRVCMYIYIYIYIYRCIFANQPIRSHRPRFPYRGTASGTKSFQ